MSVDISEVRLPDEAFWQEGANRGLDPLVGRFKKTHFGVLVDAPREIALSSRKTLPLFAYYLGTTQQVASRSFLEHGLLVAVDPDQNELYLADPEPDNGEREPAQGAAGGGDVMPGWMAEIKTLDVRALAQLPWKPGRIISQVLLLDIPSNRVETKLNAGSTAFVDTEKEKFLAAERAKRDPSAPFPALPASAYEKSTDSPAVPAATGIALKASRVMVMDGKAPALLHGSFRLWVAPEERVKPEASAYNKAHSLTGNAACLKIHLLVVGTGQATPFQYRLQIPAKEISEGFATGYFTLDLSKLPDFPQSEQTVFLYAYAKDAATEPVTIGLIDRRPAQ